MTQRHDIEAALTALAECRKNPAATPALKTLKTLVANLVKAPTEEKFHSVKLSNPKIRERLVSIPQSIAFLKALGFIERDNILKIESVDAPALAPMLKTLQEAVEARDGTLKRENMQPNMQSANKNLKRPKVCTLSLKQQALADKAEREKKERAQRLLEKQQQLKRIAADNHARKNDPNWKSGVSAAAGKGGTSIQTFRDKFREGGA